MNDINTADLEQDGIVYGLAQACVEAMHTIAAKVTPEGFIQEAVQLTGENNPERIAQFLHELLAGLRGALGDTGPVKVEL